MYMRMTCACACTSLDAHVHTPGLHTAPCCMLVRGRTRFQALCMRSFAFAGATRGAHASLTHRNLICGGRACELAHAAVWLRTSLELSRSGRTIGDGLSACSERRTRRGLVVIDMLVLSHLRFGKHLINAPRYAAGVRLLTEAGHRFCQAEVGTLPRKILQNNPA